MTSSDKTEKKKGDRWSMFLLKDKSVLEEEVKKKKFKSFLVSSNLRHILSIQ